MVSVLESKVSDKDQDIKEQKAMDQARDIGSHMSASDMKYASGKDGQQSPNTPGQDVNQGGQDLECKTIKIKVLYFI